MLFNMTRQNICEQRAPTLRNLICWLVAPSLVLPILDDGQTPIADILDILGEFDLDDLMCKLRQKLLRLLVHVLLGQPLGVEQIKSHILCEVWLHMVIGAMPGHLVIGAVAGHRTCLFCGARLGRFSSAVIGRLSFRVQGLGHLVTNDRFELSQCHPDLVRHAVAGPQDYPKACILLDP